MKLTLFHISNGMFGFYIVNIVHKSQTFLFDHENMSISSPKHDMSRGNTIRSETANVRFETPVSQEIYPPPKKKFGPPRNILYCNALGSETRASSKMKIVNVFASIYS